MICANLLHLRETPHDMRQLISSIIIIVFFPFQPSWSVDWIITFECSSLYLLICRIVWINFELLLLILLYIFFVWYIQTSPQAKRHKSSLHVISLHFFSLLWLFSLLWQFNFFDYFRFLDYFHLFEYLHFFDFFSLI